MNIILTQEFEVAATNIAAQAFPTTEFQLLSQKIGNDNLAITFKGKKHFSDNFRVRFFPKNKILILSGYYREGMSHLNYIPSSHYNWFNGKGYKIISPNDIGEKFELLAKKFYPFLEEFFLG